MKAKLDYKRNESNIKQSKNYKQSENCKQNENCKQSENCKHIEITSKMVNIFLKVNKLKKL